MNITQFILIVAIFNFILSFYVLKSNFKHPLNRSFSLCSFLIGLWVFLNYLFQKSNSIFILRSIYALAPFLILSGVLWIVYLKYKELDRKISIVNICLVVVNLIFASLMFTSNKMISGVVDYSHYSTGYLFSIFTYYIVALFLGFLVYLIVEYIKSNQIFRRQLKLITIGMFFVVIISAIVGFILPAMGITKFNVLDSPSSIFFVLLGAYSIMKHELLDIRSAAIEVITYALMVLMFIVLFILDEAGFILKSLSFLLIVYGSYSLIRNVQKELQTRKHIEKLNLRLERDKKQLIKNDKLKDEFIMMTNHELSTPITAIRGKLSMAVLENAAPIHLDENEKEYFMPVLTAADRLNHLSRQLIDVTTIDQEKVLIYPEPTVLDDLIKEVIIDFQESANLKNDKLIYAPTQKSKPINLDPKKIKAVISSLVENGIHFTNDGKITIETKLDESKQNVIVSVADTGAGVDESAKDLFNKFSQSNRFDKNSVEQQGAGLSLYIAKNYIKLHGGKIWFESEKSKGSTFYFSLPTTLAMPKAAKEDANFDTSQFTL